MLRKLGGLGALLTALVAVAVAADPVAQDAKTKAPVAAPLAAPVPVPPPLTITVTVGNGTVLTTDEVPTLNLVELAVETDKKLMWFPPTGVQTRMDSGGKALTLFFPTPGYYRFVITEQGDNPRGLDRTFKAVPLVPPPKPVPPTPEPKPPEPEPKPPEPPIPTGDFRVLMVWESMANNDRELLNILYSTQISAYLNEKTVKYEKVPEWRRWDQNVTIVEKSPTIKQLYDAVSKSPETPAVPYLAIAKGSSVFTYPLTARNPGDPPVTEQSVLALLKTYGDVPPAKGK